MPAAELDETALIAELDQACYRGPRKRLWIHPKRAVVVALLEEETTPTSDCRVVTIRTWQQADSQWKQESLGQTCDNDFKPDGEALLAVIRRTWKQMARRASGGFRLAPDLVAREGPPQAVGIRMHNPLVELKTPLAGHHLYATGERSLLVWLVRPDHRSARRLLRYPVRLSCDDPSVCRRYAWATIAEAALGPGGEHLILVGHTTDGGHNTEDQAWLEVVPLSEAGPSEHEDPGE